MPVKPYIGEITVKCFTDKKKANIKALARVGLGCAKTSFAL